MRRRRWRPGKRLTRGDWSLEVNPSNYSGLHLRGGWGGTVGEPETGWLSLSWGNGNSDPFWAVDLERIAHPGRFLRWLIDRLDG